MIWEVTQGILTICSSLAYPAAFPSENMSRHSSKQIFFWHTERSLQLVGRALEPKAEEDGLSRHRASPTPHPVCTPSCQDRPRHCHDSGAGRMRNASRSMASTDNPRHMSSFGAERPMLTSRRRLENSLKQMQYLERKLLWVARFSTHGSTSLLFT